MILAHVDEDDKLTHRDAVEQRYSNRVCTIGRFINTSATFLQTFREVLGDITCTLKRLVDLPGNSCVLHLDLFWTFVALTDHVYHIKSVGRDQFFACLNTQCTFIFLSHALYMCLREF